MVIPIVYGLPGEELFEESEKGLVRVCFAPGMDRPLCTDITSSVRPATDPQDYFSFDSMKKNITISDLDYSLTGLGSFYNPDLSFNNPE